MRQLATLILFVAMAAPPAFAARPDRPAATRPTGGMPGVDAMIERMRSAVKDLELSEAQKMQIDDIIAKARKDLSAMKGELESMSFRERAQQVRELAEGVRRDIGQVLTPEQIEKLGEKMDQAGERFRGRFARGRAATTRPSGEPPRGAAPSRQAPLGEQMAERLRQNLAKLDLSEDQRAKLKTLLEDLREKGEALRSDLANAGPEAREKFRALMNEAREGIAQILTAQQRETLRDLMETPPDGPGGPDGAEKRRRQRARDGDAKASAPMKDDDAMMMQDGMTGERATRRGGAGAPEKSRPAGPSIGEAAPEISLQRLDGTRLQLSALKGRVVVLVFGSWSCPVFRNRAQSLDQLKTETGTRAQFFVIYTREAHPAGEWEVARNKTDEISVEQPRSDDERKTLAQTARQKLGLSTPIALDSIDNTAAKAFGAGANSAYVIDRDGKIAARQEWFEPMAMKRAIDKVTRASDSAGATTNRAP